MPRSLVPLGLCLSACACSSSVQIARGDPAFGRARARLARSQAAVAATTAGPDEKIRFLQAEGFYRYRFAFPPRSVGTYLAQAAAVVIELPALQAVAGSLDVMDLRLRACDSAVQLWEALLSDYPTTPLRPLALYRLGWAYRSAGVAGLPRRSGDDAFDLLIGEYPALPLVDLARAAKAVAWKSKDTATGLSLVPGLGQMYVGERLNGSVRLAIALASVAMIVVPVVIAYQRRNELTWRRDWPLLASGIGGVAILSIDYTTAYQDALRGVVEWNERAEEAFENQHPDAP